MCLVYSSGMDLEVLVGVLIGLLSVAESSLNVTESLSVAGSEGM